MDNFDIVITCASGVETFVKRELKTLGFPEAKAVDGKITVRGGGLDIARLTMFLHTAERVYIKLTTFVAEDFNALFDMTYAYDWDTVIPFNAKLLINGKSRNSKLFALSSCQSIIKKAILEKLKKHYSRTVFPESGETYSVDFGIVNDEVTLYLDACGMGLHKRGYRDWVGEAPIKETLACAMLYLSDFSYENAFCDPFCGSGTIAIEAARLALNIAPGRDRNFDYTAWDFIPRGVHELALAEARDGEKDLPLHFCAYDIDKNAITLALRHAERAGVRDKLHIQVRDVAELKSRFSDGCIVTNPPYGERLLNQTEAYALYKTLGEVWQKLNNWSIFVITSAPKFEKYFGKKSDANRKFFNAEKECHYYEYFRKKITD